MMKIVDDVSRSFGARHNCRKKYNLDGGRWILVLRCNPGSIVLVYVECCNGISTIGGGATVLQLRTRMVLLVVDVGDGVEDEWTWLLSIVSFVAIIFLNKEETTALIKVQSKMLYRQDELIGTAEMKLFPFHSR
jgi:hypothetical protein